MDFPYNDAPDHPLLLERTSGCCTLSPA